MKRMVIIPLLLSLTACSLSPRLLKPVPPIPKTFSPAEGEATQGPASELGWRTVFRDPRLQRMIELALVNNRDLRLAVLNVDSVRAQYGIQRAGQLPSIEATGNMSRQRIAASTDASPAVPASVQNQYSMNLGLSAFEIDLFGRMRSLSNAAFARYLASDHGRRATQISLIGGVADAYLAEQLAEEQQHLAEQTLTDWKQSLDLTRRLKDANQYSGLDVAQAEGQVATAEADLEARKRTTRQAHNALQLLVGTELPTDLPKAMPLEEQSVLTNLPVGMPSDLLLHRPDILQAEQNLVAANAEIGAARAAFFPRISLTSSLGYLSSATRNLFNNDQRTWAFTPQISLPIFQGGRLRAEKRLAEIRKSAAVVEYERVIQVAFREVVDGLAGRETYGRQITAQARVAQSAERRASLSMLRYQAGVDGRLELLDSQRQLYAARQALLELRRSEFSNAVALYKALGGGLAVSNSTTHSQCDPPR